MALEVREGSFKAGSRPSGGYLLGVPVVASNKLAFKNDYTKDRRSGNLQPPLTPDRNRRGTRGGKVSKNPRLASAPRVIGS